MNAENTKNTTNMPKAVPYIRFSSGTQSHGSSQERQQSMIDAWLAQNPEYKLSSLTFADLGRSGFSGEHLKHGLGKIRAAIQAKKITEGDHILVEAIDRIGRLEPMHMLTLIQEIISEGVLIVTLEDAQVYSKESLNKPDGSLFILVGKIQQAHEYSKNLSRRLSAAFADKRERAKIGEPIKALAPFWLKNTGEVIPENGAVVKDCINLYLKGHGAKQILLMLREKHQVLDSIQPRTLTRWLRNRALIGDWETKGEIIPNVFEPLIDSPTFYHVQREINKRSKQMSPEQTYELSGIVVCGHCHKRFYFRRKKFKDKTIIYANCSTYLRRGKPYCENNITWPYEVLLYFYDLTKNQVISNASYDWFAQQQSQEIEKKRYELENVEKQLQRFATFLEDVDDIQSVIEKAKELKSQKSQLSNDIKLLEDAIINNDIPESSFDQAMESIDSRVQETLNDSIHTREALKDFGYRIAINDKAALISSKSKLLASAELRRRSTKYDCYIVSATLHRVYNYEKGMGHIEIYSDYDYFLAINRTGLIFQSETEDELMRYLDHKKHKIEYTTS